MATKTEPGRGPAAIADGDSIRGAHAKSVARNPGGTLSGGNRDSVSGPVRGGASPALARAANRKAPQAPRARMVGGIAGEEADSFMVPTTRRGLTSRHLRQGDHRRGLTGG